MRWFTPIFLLGAAGFVAWYNASHPLEKLVFPFLEWVPGVGSDPEALGNATIVLLAGLGVLSLAETIWRGDGRMRDESGEQE
jgi:hypothetical protein